MNILLASDLHTNFHKDSGKSIIKGLSPADVVVIAGDLSIIINNSLQDSIKMLCDKYPDVVYVSGNHEYYHSSFYIVDQILTDLDAQILNFSWLNNSKKVIQGQAFIGATLWFKETPEATSQKHWLNDFNCIKDCDPLVFEKYVESVAYLKNNIQPNDIVVTHHLPTYKSISPKFANSSINCYFANKLDDLIKNTRPKLWFHGHTHTICDYIHYSTRIVCNPFGYPGENMVFNDSKIIGV